MFKRILIAVLNLTLLAVRPLPAQTVRGMVVEAGSRAAVDAALVVLLNERADSVATTHASKGAFRILAPSAGRFMLRVQRIGFATSQTEPIELLSGQDVVVEVVLGVEAVPLQPLTVISRGAIPLHPQLIEVNNRRRQGFGRFIMRQDIDDVGSTTLRELLDDVPGVTVRDTGEGDLVVQLRAGMAGLGKEARGVVDPRVQAFMAHSKCPVKLYVDGTPWIRGHEFDIGMIQVAMDRTAEFFAIPPSLIEAIEVYNGPASTPAIFGGSDAQCGVIAVWTRRAIR